MQEATVNAIVLLLYTIVDIVEIIHSKFKYFIVNDKDVSILNTTVAADPVPEYVTVTELSKFVPKYILHD